MFCFQCEQTAKGTGCTAFGVCGKDPETAVLQDLLVYAQKGISQYAHRARQLGARDHEVDVFALEALFTTVTNVNFDPKRIEVMLRKAAGDAGPGPGAVRERLRGEGRQPESPGRAGGLEPGADLDGLIRQGEQVSVESRIAAQGAGRHGPAGTADLRAERHGGLRRPRAGPRQGGRSRLRLLPRGAGFPDPKSRRAWTSCSAMNLKCGEVNLKVMGLLDGANTGAYGHPGADPGAHHAGQGQGHPGFRPRPEGPGGTAQADRGQGHQHLHARRNAAGPRLSRAEEVQAPCRATTAGRGRTSARSSTRFPAPS